LLFKDLLARKAIAPTEVDLACAVNKDRALDKSLHALAAAPGREDDVGHAAVRACLGGADAHDRTLAGLVSADDADVRIAQVYLRHRPIADASELRTVTRAIAAMNGSEAQTRALDVLARHYLSDQESVATLQQLFVRTRSSSVQNAIAGVLIRADAKVIGSADLLRTLRENRLKSSSAGNMVEALIQRLQMSGARLPDGSLAELRNRSR
jgi:hypothetical protein